MKLEVIKFKNYCEPNRAQYNDSGADIFCTKDITIPAGKTIAIPTGVGVHLPDGYDIVVHCKSGLSKKGIWASNAPIDAGYTGEIHAILFNTTDTDYTFKKGDKIGQFVMRPVIYPEYVDVISDSRGADGFGSTGK